MSWCFKIEFEKPLIEEAVLNERIVSNLEKVMIDR